jgi:EmrB/QacA subfamily drug resistance transporter
VQRFVGFLIVVREHEGLKYKWVALTVTTVGVLMVGIDTRIVIVGLPQVAAQLHADAEQAIWITQSYVLANTVLLLLIGRLGDIFGRVRIYIVGFGIFTIGSALTSIGLDPIQVIVFRAVQGVGAALVFTNSIAILTDATPRNELGFSLGINQIAFRSGAILGLTLSGLILSLFDWRALFYINIPIGVFGTFWARRRLREAVAVDREAKIDWLGFALFTTFLLCLMIGLTLGAYSPSEFNTLYVLLFVGAIFLGLFIIRSRRVKHPLVELSMFKIREVTGGIFAMFFNIITWTAVLLLLSLQFQLVLDMTPLEAGIRILPFEIAFLAVGPLSGRLSDRFNRMPFILSGLTLSTVALFLFSTTNQNTSYLALSVLMIILGVGTGLFIAPNLRSIMGSVPPQRRGIGSALFALFVNLGLTVSLNLAILVMSFTAPYEVITRIISAINPTSIPVAERLLFVESLKNTYLAFGVVNALAIIPSLLQINFKSKVNKTENNNVEVEAVLT